MRCLLFLLLLTPQVSLSSADDKLGETQTYFKYGVGVFKSAENSITEVKTISVGRQRPLGSYLLYQYELGGWTDTRYDVGRHDSAFASLSAGINLNLGPFYAQSLWGGALLTSTDAYLGGHGQFKQDLSVGIKDLRGVVLGVVYTHISSAGIEQPNIGRDFAAIKLGIPW